MWFEHALGKDKIAFMFNNEFSLEEVQLESIFLHDVSTLRFQFLCKNIPKAIPKKWNEKGFNAISFVFSLGGIFSLDIKGEGVGFFCNPEIKTFEGKSIVHIVNEGLILHCESRFLTIEGFTPYIDERWD